jgi:tetratricopeptide (TPR) repeat protein
VLAFAALFLGGGSSQSRLFWIGCGAVIVAAAGWALRPPRLSAPAAAFLALLAAFVLWQAVSIAWSIQAGRSWDYANRGLVYFAFAAVGTLLGAAAPRRFALAAATLLGALFAWALFAKVIPDLHEDYGRLARLRYPVGYWNVLGLLAAASVPIGLWLLRERWARLGGALLLYTALVVAVLTYSRLSIILTVAAAVAWLAFERKRMAELAMAWVPAAAVVGIALLLPGVSDNGQPYDVRLQDGLLFGVVVIAGALAVAAAMRYVIVAPRIVRALAAVLVVLVLAGIAAAIVRSGGPVDFVRDRWHEFSNPVSAQVANTPGRFATASSSNRWRWWQEAWNAFVDHPVRGTGAGTFGLTDRLERDTSLAVLEPHSAPLQDLSETGIVGFLLIVGALVAAAFAILRRERTAATMALVVAAAICVAHSLVDIDWDYVAVQGPLFLTVGALVSSGPEAAPRRRPLLVAVVVVSAAAALYSLAAPWLADTRLDAAYDALVRTDIAAARDEAQSAHALNPLDVEAFWVWALSESLAGRNGKALELYRRARDREPKNPETWYRLGEFELSVLKQPRRAYRDLNHSYTLDSYGPAGIKGGALDRARCQVDPATCPR